MRSSAVAAGLLLVVAACGTAQERTESTSTVASTTVPDAPATTVTMPPLQIDLCSQAQPRPWSVLCEAYLLIVTHHVDLPEPSALSAAAAAGVRAVYPTGDPIDVQDADRCIVPHASFEPVCEAIADRMVSEAMPLDVLVEGAIQGMFRYGLDPFSAYVGADYADRLDDLGSGLILSLGVVVGARDDQGAACGPIGDPCLLRVLDLFEFGAAERAGVVLDDVIESVDGVAVDGLSETEAVAALSGEPGTATSVTIARSTGSSDKVLVHEDIRLVPAEFEMLDDRLAYLRLNDFSQVAAQLTGNVLSDPRVQSADAMILDLRGNPGGLVLSAQAVASQFLDGGLVLVEQGRDGSFALPVIDGGLAPAGLRLVVLTDRGTASAGEIVAAVLQERGRAVVVGEPTFGKSLVQQIFTAIGGGEYRISVARWTTPGGTEIAVTGVQPDVLVDRSGGGDPVLEAALRLLGR